MLAHLDPDRGLASPRLARHSLLERLHTSESHRDEPGQLIKPEQENAAARVVREGAQRLPQALVKCNPPGGYIWL